MLKLHAAMGRWTKEVQALTGSERESGRIPGREECAEPVPSCIDSSDGDHDKEVGDGTVSNAIFLAVKDVKITAPGC